MMENPATRPAAVGVLLTLAAGAAEGTFSELIRALMGTQDGLGNPVLPQGLTAVCVVAVLWVAWTEPEERRGEALLTGIVVILSAFAVGLGWYPDDNPRYAWMIGAAVLSFYIAMSLPQVEPAGRGRQVTRIVLMAVLGLAGIPATAGLARAEPRAEIPCAADVEAIAQQIRAALPDALDDAVAGYYAANSAEAGCPDDPFGPHIHGVMHELRFKDGTHGRALLVSDESGDVSLVPAAHRNEAVIALASNRVIHLMTWRGRDTKLFVFKRDDGRCTVRYGNGKGDFTIPEAQAAAFLRLVTLKRRVPIAHQEEIRQGTPPLVAVFRGPGNARSEYRLTVDADGGLVPPPSAEWLKDVRTCPNSLHHIEGD